MTAPPPASKVPMESFMESMDARGIIVVTLWIRIIGVVIIRVGIIVRRVVFSVIARVRHTGSQDDNK